MVVSRFSDLIASHVPDILWPMRVIRFLITDYLPKLIRSELASVFLHRPQFAHHNSNHFTMNTITTPAPLIASTTTVNTSNNQSHEGDKAGTTTPAPAPAPVHLSTMMTTTTTTNDNNPNGNDTNNK